MKVLLLCQIGFKPPTKVINVTHADNSIWRTEYYVREALFRLGHEVKVTALRDSMRPLKTDIKHFQPDVVFNLIEEFSGEGLLEPLIASYLESVKQPFTGCSSLALILSKNKIAAKSILLAARVPVPGNKKYPKIVKLLDEESSRGITDKSVVNNKAEEIIQIKILKKKFNSGVFTEEYISGRELHVAILKNKNKLIVSQIWETVFGEKTGAHIISEKIKWNFAFRDKIGVQLVPALGLSEQLTNKVKKTALDGCRALEIDGYARVDIRLTKNNKIFILEVNPNPDISFGDEFAECVRSSGIEYDQLIAIFLDEAIKRQF